MSKIIILGEARSLVNYRGKMLSAMVNQGHTVIGVAPNIPVEIKSVLGQIGVESIEIPLHRTGLNPIKDVLTFYSLIALFRNIKPDIVLSYTVKPVIYGSFAAKAVHVPHIFSMITGLGYAFIGNGIRQHFVKAIIRTLYKISLKNNEKIFFQNPDDYNLFLKIGILKDTSRAVLINGSGVDIDYFQPVSLPKIITFIFLSRLIIDKGVLEYIEAARIIKKKNPNIVFRLTGWIDENPKSIKSKELNSWIKEGIIEYSAGVDDVRPAIYSSSIFVLPSYREGMPRGVLEAMSMARPILTTDVPGCRETVKNGFNGFLVPAQNSSALADAMQKFIDNPELIELMGLRSRKIVVDKFDVNKVNAVILKTLGIHKL